MAEMADGVATPSQRRKFSIADLWRTALWGMAAAFALVLFALAATSETGRQRIARATGEFRLVMSATKVAPVNPFDAKDGQKLADAVRILTADRDRTNSRLAELERHINSLAGSVDRVEKAALELQKTLPRGQTAAARQPPLPSVDAAEGITSSIDPALVQPATRSSVATQEQKSPDVEANRLGFGLDIGSAKTVEGLRALWIAALQRHPAQLDGLQPIVHLRERPHLAGSEMRLVAGPLPNAVAAAKLCGQISAAGGICQPSAFNGRRLAVH